MKNVKIFIGVCLVAMTMLFVYACTKDELKLAQSQDNTKFRGDSEIGSKTILWVDNFRKNLYENRDSMYEIGDVVTGLEIILNLYKSQGIGNFVQYDILKKDYAVSLNQNGKVSTSTLRGLFEQIYLRSKEQFEQTIFPNKVMGNFAIKVRSNLNGVATVEVTSIVGQSDLNDQSTATLETNETICMPTFSTNTCYKSGYGDADYFKEEQNSNLSFGRPLIDGGKCDGTLIGKTAAHEEVQKKFTAKIPKTVNLFNNKGATSHMVKFVNQECKGIVISRKIDDYNNFNNCSNNLLNDNTDSNFYPTTLYDANSLNCAYCIINNWVKEQIPSPKQLSYMNIFTDKLLSPNNPTGLNNTKWYVEICWGDPVLIPILNHKNPELSPTEDVNYILDPNPYSNLNVNVSTIIKL